jgi:hypothetical protein
MSTCSVLHVFASEVVAPINAASPLPPPLQLLRCYRCAVAASVSAATVMAALLASVLTLEHAHRVCRATIVAEALYAALLLLTATHHGIAAAASTAITSSAATSAPSST